MKNLLLILLVASLAGCTGGKAGDGEAAREGEGWCGLYARDVVLIEDLRAPLLIKRQQKKAELPDAAGLYEVVRIDAENEVITFVHITDDLVLEIPCHSIGVVQDADPQLVKSLRKSGKSKK